MGFGDWVKDKAGDVGGFVEDKVDDAGEWLEGAYEDGKETVGGWVDDGSSALADVLDHVGLDGAANFVEDTGDDIADALGDEVSERELGESDDPKQLVHGEVEKINEVATHLSSFAGSMASASSGLGGIDAGGWTGSAADGFEAKMSAQPKKWSTAGDACGDAAKAWTSYASTVTWAQGQAKSAIQQYEQGKKASESAVKAHNDKVDTWNKAVNAGTPADQMPADPGTFTDPGKADMEAAQHTLDQARKQRDEAAERAASTIRSATAGAPQEPDFTDRMGANASDLMQMRGVWDAHITGGVLKGTGSLVKFVRGLNPTDPYNMRNPAAYLEGLSNTTTGLIHTANHPVEAVSAIIGSGWTTDPAEAFGELLPNLVGTVGTGGAGAAASIGSRTAVRSLEEILQRGATRGLEDVAERGALRGADDLVTSGAPRWLDDVARRGGDYGPGHLGDPADLSSALARNGWDHDDLVDIVNTRTSTLSPGDIADLNRVRDAVPRPDADTLMQKVIDPTSRSRYLGDGEVPDYFDPTQVRNSVTRAGDSAHLDNPAALHDDLRLDYKDSPYSAADDSTTVLRFKTEGEYEVPRHSNMGGDGSFDDPKKWEHPFTGNGFTKSHTDPMPEWQPRPDAEGNRSVTMNEGAEMWTIGKDGSQHLDAVFDGQSWVKVR